MTHIKFIPNKSKSISYPVGAHIAANKKGINDLKRIMKETIGTKKHITLWCRGSSGAIIAGIISLGFPKSVINHVKKSGESSHSRGHYIIKDHTTNIIIDDFSNTGETLNDIYEDMVKEVGVSKIDYVCVIAHANVAKLSFIPENIISRYLYLDKQENYQLKEEGIIEKYTTSPNFKVVGKDNVIDLHPNIKF